ncbi:MAG TPA: arylamine N-acetyltransferase [Rhizobacter sp.]|nr:arylamine N-acetyltransferase [Rhizobacter sp.]
MIRLDTYFQRIGYAGPRAATLEVLQDLCALHCDRIAYENIDPLLGTGPTLALAALQTKLIEQGRGGYCYEHNLLLKDVLLQLGMQVTALAARVVWMQPPAAPPRARSHMLLKVEVADQDGAYIADVGFGGHRVNLPLRFTPDLPQRSSDGQLRITNEGDEYTVESLLPAGWAPMYRFTLQPQLDIDYEPLNWFTGTHPGSIFCHNLLMERLTPQLRTGLFNDRLIRRRPGEPPQVRRIASQADFEAVLIEQFELHLPQAVLGRLYERVPKGLDQFVVPAAT